MHLENISHGAMLNTRKLLNYSNYIVKITNNMGKEQDQYLDIHKVSYTTRCE